MSDHSRIEWTQASWNPVVGCEKVSAGCTHCYAIDTAYRLEHNFGQAAYAGTTRKLPDGSHNWTGTVRCLPERLGDPLKWREPRRVFVNSMSDLFHPDVPADFIDRVFAVMALAERHTYQILTKRPERMLAYLVGDGITRRRWIADAAGQNLDDRWPLPNVWLGVSTEDQRTADERIPLLLQTPAVVRFLSCEPLLGRINLNMWLEPLNLPIWPEMSIPKPGQDYVEPLGGGGWVIRRRSAGPHRFEPWKPEIDWVIAGGESGPQHRPMDLAWARLLRDQCHAAGVAFHFKQHGDRTHAAGGRSLDGRTHDEYPIAREAVTA